MKSSVNEYGDTDFGLRLGQSQSRIQIIESELHGKTVQKLSFENPDRLNKQFKKHVEALSLGLKNISIPRIVEGFDNGAYQMEYIQGLPLGEYLEVASHVEVTSVAEMMESYFDQTFNMSRPTSIKAKFTAKLELLAQTLISKQDCPSELVELHSQIIKNVNFCSDIEGWNHGDLSFENIMVNGQTGNIILLDFLDSPFESPMIDIGRFWLDARFGWWGSGMYASANAQLNAELLASMVVAQIKKLNLSVREVAIFTGLAILRIYPYTKGPVRLAFLKNASYEIVRLLK